MASTSGTSTTSPSSGLSTILASLSSGTSSGSSGLGSTTGNGSGVGTLSSTGIGSGLDVSSIISKLVAIEQQPITQLQTQTTSLQNDVSIYGQIQSSISSMVDAAQTLADPSTWNAGLATSTNSSVATATTGSGALPANYSVTVSQLATAQSVTSSVFADPTQSIGSGSLTITLGTWGTNSSGSPSFTAQTPSTSSTTDPTTGTTTTTTTGKPATVNIAAGASLNDVVAAINGANAGVTASLVTDSTGSRLLISSNQTGAANGFQITANDADGNNTDANGLSQIAYDPTSATVGTTLNQAGTDAKATLNGIALTSPSNTLNNVVTGVNLTLTGVSSTVTTNGVSSSAATNISVTDNAGAQQTDITAFVTSYNALINLVRTNTAYDASTSTAAPLQGDTVAEGIESQLRNIAAGSTSLGGAFSRLADLGIDPQADGTLKVDSTTLTSALNDPTDLKQFFMGIDSSNSANNGFAQQFLSWGNTALAAGGAVPTAEQSLQSRISNNNQTVSDMQDRVNLYQQRLQAQYSALDTQMASLTSLSSYVSQQVTAWDSSK